MSGTFMRGALRALAGRGQQIDSKVAPGLHESNVLDTVHVAIADGNIQPLQYNPTALAENQRQIPILLFLQDHPIELSVELLPRDPALFTTTAPATFTMNVPSYKRAIGYQSASAQHANVFAADAAAYPYGQHATGDSFTNGVEVSGYMGLMDGADPALTNDQAGEMAYDLNVQAISEGAGTHGFPARFNLANFEPEGPETPQVSVILDESDYTQAMADAGNEFTGANGMIAKIVGLWAIQDAVV